MQSAYCNGKYIFIWRGNFNNNLSILNIIINYIIKYLLNVSMQTNTFLIYKEN